MSYILFQGILLFICNFPIHVGGRPSKFLMSVIGYVYLITSLTVAGRASY